MSNTNKQMVLIITCVISALVLFIIAEPWLFFGILKWWRFADHIMNGVK